MMTNIFGAPSYVPLEALRLEVGCLTIKERAMRSKLGYINYIFNGNSAFLRKIVTSMTAQERNK